MTCLRTAVADRLERLTAVLIDLRERVRAAVASELGTAVGDAVRDLVAAVVRHRPGSPLEREPRVHRPDPDRRCPHDPWDDESEGDWADREGEDDGHSRRCRPTDDDRFANRPPTDPPPSGWMTAITLGAGVARRVVAGRGPLWVGVLAGGLVLFGSLAGGPVVRAVAGAVQVACELIPFAHCSRPAF